MDERIIREEECKKLTGSSRSTRYRWERQGLFPLRKELGPNSVGWLLSEIVAWIASRNYGKTSNHKSISNFSNNKNNH